MSTNALIDDPHPWECRACGDRSWQKEDRYFVWSPREGYANFGTPAPLATGSEQPRPVSGAVEGNQ